jgi:O-methyltransferase
MSPTNNQASPACAASKKSFPISLIKTICIHLIRTADVCRQILAFTIFGPRKVGCLARIRIIWRILYARNRNPNRIAASFGEQLVLVRSILEIPSEKPGAVAEFGCYKGLSTVVISIAARYAARRLIVFDSFQGLPEPMETVHQVASGKVIEYKKGSYAGTLEEVRSVVAQYGEIDQVEFVQGFFCHSLPSRPADERYALIFEDADLVESVRDVLKHAWPRLQNECLFFSHEALDLEVTKLFFNDAFWLEVHGCKAPGLAGVGMGLPIDAGKWGASGIRGIFGSCLAGIIKR